MQFPEYNMLDEWLEEYNDPEIEAEVERELKELHEGDTNLPDIKPINRKYSILRMAVSY